MKLSSCFLVTLAFVALYFAPMQVVAAPQHAQTLLYYPNRYPQPQIHTLPYYPDSQRPQTLLLRARRETVVAKDIAPAANGGIDGKVAVGHVIRDSKNPNTNVVLSASAAGNTKSGPVTTSLGAAVNLPAVSVGITKEKTPGLGTSITKTAQANLFENKGNTINAKAFTQDNKLGNGFEFQKKGASLDWQNYAGHGLSISKESIPGFKDTLTKSANVNLFNNGVHSFDLGASQAKTTFANGFRQDNTAGSLGWSHANGHGANLGLTRFSGIGDRLDLNSRANLFSSSDGRARLDAYGGGSRWLNGPFRNRDDFNFGVGGSYMFG